MLQIHMMTWSQQYVALQPGSAEIPTILFMAADQYKLITTQLEGLYKR